MSMSFTLPQAEVDWLEARAERLGTPQRQIVADLIAKARAEEDPANHPARIEVAAKSHPAVARGFEDRGAAKPFAPQPKPGKGASRLRGQIVAPSCLLQYRFRARGILNPVKRPPLGDFVKDPG